ncbi:MAG: helix-turn-helix transcriptional regulator [Theionarchaea archaeon]|nr:helix-turn-helix transcriptional regulator [Theionarchaea archaeon]MBU7038245.1 helix-turn-helix transcriptional regulator [Theionarchaea archaeon]
MIRNDGDIVPLERLKTKMTKEVMWLYVLRLLMERPMYAYEIKKQIRNRFEWEAATVTSYVVFYNLKKEGYVTTEWVESKEGRPNRKYYAITDRGRELFNKGREFMEEMMQSLFGEVDDEGYLET